MAVGDSVTPDEIRSRADFRQHTAELREIPLGELNIFDSEELGGVADYQARLTIDALVQALYSDSFIDRYGERAHMLGDNTSTYDESTEDAILTDKVAIGLLDARRTNPKDLKLAEGYRCRRSIVALLLKQEQGELPKVKLPKAKQNKTKTSSSKSK